MALKRAPNVLMAGMAGSTIWMVLTLLASAFLSWNVSQLNQESASLDQQYKTIQAERAPLLLKNQIASAVDAAAAKVRTPVASILGRVAAAATPGVSTTSIHVQPDGKVTIEGEATDTRSMQVFASNLNLGRSIRSPYFEAFRRDAKAGITFRIVGLYRGSESTVAGK
jgi:hypothetical protein